MICNHCGTETPTGSFCTGCGGTLAAATTTSTQSTFPTTPPAQNFVDKFMANTTAKIGTGIGLLVVLIIIFSLAQESPAVGYLKTACATVADVDFSDNSSDENQTVLDNFNTQVNLARAEDSELASPFDDIASDLGDVIDYQSEAESAYASYSIWSWTIFLSRALTAIGNASSSISTLDSTISTVCADYKS